MFSYIHLVLSLTALIHTEVEYKSYMCRPFYCSAVHYLLSCPTEISPFVFQCLGQNESRRLRGLFFIDPGWRDLEFAVCIKVCVSVSMCVSSELRELWLPSCVNRCWPHCDCVSTLRRRRAEEKGEKVKGTRRIWPEQRKCAGGEGWNTGGSVQLIELK